GLLRLHDHRGRGAVRQLAGVAGGDEAALLDLLAAAEHRLQRRQALKRGVGAVALVLRQGDLFGRGLAGGLVDDLHGGGHRRDLGVEPPLGLGPGGALLGLQGVFVLGLAADPVALGDDLGRLQHRHVDVRVQRLEIGVLEAEQVHVLVLHQGDRLQPAADGDDLAVVNDLLRRRGDGHQARGALPVQAHAGGGRRQAGGQRGLAADVGAGRALLQGGAHHYVLDLGRVDPGALHRVADGVTAQLLGLGVVEGPAIGPAARRAGGGGDDGFAHGKQAPCPRGAWREDAGTAATPMADAHALPALRPIAARGRRASARGPSRGTGDRAMCWNGATVVTFAAEWAEPPAAQAVRCRRAPARRRSGLIGQQVFQNEVTMRLKLLAGAAVSVLFAATGASAEPDGWYGAVDVGGHWADDIETTHGGPVDWDWEASPDGGWLALARLGY